MIRSKAYIEIRDRLSDSIPDLYIDLQKGQYKQPSQNNPIPLPACLIEFRQVMWSDTTGGQIGDSAIIFYLYLDLVTESYKGSEQEENTLKIIDILDKLYETFQGFSGENFNAMTRVSDGVMEYANKYVCYKTEFKTLLHQDDKEKVRRPRPEVVINSNSE